MIPPFDIQGGLPLALARAASVAGLASAAGSLAYAGLLRPADLPDALTRHLRLIGFASLAAALTGTLLWLAVQTQDMAGSLGPASMWSLLAGTLFGHLIAARLALLVIATGLCVRRRMAGAALAACAALLLQAGHSHAEAMGGSRLLLASAALHILAGGVWLGSLPALFAVVAASQPALAWQAAARFSIAGIACVLLLLFTATVQFSQLVVTLPGLVGTAYGWMAGAKILLFVALLALAARNRFRLTPRLAAARLANARGPDPAPARHLQAAILLEIALGLLVFAAAGVLTELEPAMHTQKLWPFAWVPSLDAAREDPDIARETLLAGVAVALGLAVLALAALARRRRAYACAMGIGGLVAIGASLPHLSPLLVPAVPTQFFRSPSGFSAASIVQGAGLYPAHCAACHGAAGHGDGPLARTLSEPPADLTAAHLWMHSDGQLFWWLTHGIEGPRGGLVMPGFATLAEDDRWALIDFIRGRNAGLTLSPAGRWATPLQAPGFPLVCASGATSLSALRGSPVIVEPGVGLVLAEHMQCAAEDAGLAAAYAIAAPGAAALLVDANGWLRAATRPGVQPPDPGLARPPLPAEAGIMPADMKM